MFPTPDDWPLLGQPLNAFRHHKRSAHAAIPARSSSIRCAQRLSASQRSALATMSPHSPETLCAQRLSASQRSARTYEEWLGVAKHVLNAFRHHRGRHLLRSQTVAELILCSTPFGITEVGTPRPDPSGRPPPRAQRLSASQRSAPTCASCSSLPSQVLNAFRHHRGRHQVLQRAW